MYWNVSLGQGTSSYQVRPHLKVSSDEALKLGGLCVRVEAFFLFSDAL